VLRIYLKSKLGPLTVTEASEDPGPGVQIDSDLLAAAHIMPGEKVRVSAAQGAAGFECHAAPARRGSGTVRVLGARGLGLGPGDRLTVTTECMLVDREALAHEPREIEVSEGNRLPAET